PQTGVPGVRHSTFESLRLVHSSQSIASNLLTSGIPRTSRKSVSLWESRFSSLMKRLFYNLQVIANTNLELPDVVGQIRSVQGFDLTKETTCVVIRLLIDP
ncbi:hypothetical protein HID58_056664, partial [Brassica napus]